MRRIKEGQLPEKAVHIVVCSYCQTEIEFLREEAKYVPDQRDGDYLAINCPLCKRLISASVR